LSKLERPMEQTTSTETWQVQLRDLFGLFSPTKKLALVGVGHPLRGDDYVGSFAVKAVMEATEGSLPDGVYLFDAEDNVEAVITRLARLGLKYVIFIDACEMGLKAGEKRLVSVTETSYPFFTTHGIPLRVLAERLLSESEVLVLAIQPKRTEFGFSLSPEIQDAATSVSKLITTNLKRGGRAIAD
jgi:hydrogenase maturation protease